MKKPTCLPIHGNCLDVLKRFIAEGVLFDSVICDPPYHLLSIVKRFGGQNAAAAQEGTDGAFKRASKGFMGKQWDGGDVAFSRETWELVFQVLKPGGHLIAFNHTRTSHRMICAIEDAGFEIRDKIAWLYGSGMPKSHDVSKAIDRAAGATREVLAEGKPVARMVPGATQNEKGWTKDSGRTYTPNKTAPATPEAEQWEGWGTALKPCMEDICLARKPLVGTVAQNVLEHGTGALNIDGCRVPAEKQTGWCGNASNGYAGGLHKNQEARPADGRWPGNVVHDGSGDVYDAFALYGPAGGSGKVNGTEPSRTGESGIYGHYNRVESKFYGDTGNAGRFFYSAKADAGERVFHCTAGCGHRVAAEAVRQCIVCGADMEGHPTVKPVDLMAWLCRLVTPPGGHVLDPFAGSGSTGIAAIREGFDATLIEMEEQSFLDIKHRLKHVKGIDTPLFAALDDAQGSLL